MLGMLKEHGQTSSKTVNKLSDHRKLSSVPSLSSNMDVEQRLS